MHIQQIVRKYFRLFLLTLFKRRYQKTTDAVEHHISPTAITWAVNSGSVIQRSVTWEVTEQSTGNIRKKSKIPLSDIEIVILESFSIPEPPENPTAISLLYAISIGSSLYHLFKIHP